MTIRVLIADDHAIVREGLRAILESHEGVTVVGEASDGREAVELASQLTPDVIIMDIGMPNLNGVEATRRIVDANPKAHVIALSTYGDKQFVLSMLEAGASAYVLKSTASDELWRAIEAVRRGETYLSSKIAGVVVEKSLRPPTAAQPITKAELSGRELEILQLVAEGQSSREIATGLTLSVKTVETHRRNIMAKLKIHSVAELTKYAVRAGLTALDH